MDELADKIRKIDGVSTIEYVSKEEALSQMKEKYGSELLEQYDGENNIFKDSYVVNLTDLKKSKEVQNQINTFDMVSKITSSDQTVEALIKLANGIKNSNRE